MQYSIVLLSTCFALFWDEALLTILGLMFNHKFSHKFTVIWMLGSGIVTSLLVSWHVPAEYRLLALIMISSGVLFNMQGKKEINNNK
jgi:hypothetical protein